MSLAGAGMPQMAVGGDLPSGCCKDLYRGEPPASPM